MQATDTQYVEGVIVAALFNPDGSAQWFEVDTGSDTLVRIYPSWCVHWEVGVRIRARMVNEQETDRLQVIGWDDNRVEATE